MPLTRYCEMGGKTPRAGETRDDSNTSRSASVVSARFKTRCEHRNGFHGRMENETKLARTAKTYRYERSRCSDITPREGHNKICLNATARSGTRCKVRSAMNSEDGDKANWQTESQDLLLLLVQLLESRRYESELNEQKRCKTRRAQFFGRLPVQRLNRSL